MDVGALVRSRDLLLTVERREASVEESLQTVLEALHSVARFEWTALLLTDTDTMLPFGGIVEGFDRDACTPFWDNELLDADFAKFIALARSADPVAVLSDETDGDLGRSPRHVKLFAPVGGGDELRVALTTGSTCWAAASLVRAAELGNFPTSEVSAVRELRPLAARVLRAAVLRRDRNVLERAPVMLVLDAQGRPETVSPGAPDVLSDFSMAGLATSTPTVVLALARRAKASRAAGGITVRARGASGTWYRLNATRLGDDGQVGVVIEPARPADIVPILLESFGLTPRESEVVPLLARGMSTKEIATELCLSRHTVSDHIKVIFAKCGVTSRGELIASLFADHVHDAHHAATIYH
jgi:DNA-binding CsgD family transcriptional regulator